VAGSKLYRHVAAGEPPSSEWTWYQIRVRIAETAVRIKQTDARRPTPVAGEDGNTGSLSPTGVGRPATGDARRPTDAALRAAYKRLGSARQVAQEFGISPTTASKRLKAMGVDLLNPGGRPRVE
jgi:hypothetical protein